MKSKAAIRNHPLHPMLVPIPIGSFFIALVGDALHTATPDDPFWGWIGGKLAYEHRVGVLELPVPSPAREDRERAAS